MMRGYAIALQRDDDGSVLATCPAMPEVTTFGSNEGEALLHAIDAVEEAIAGRIADWAAMPAPSLPMPGEGGFAPLAMKTLLQVELYRRFREQGVMVGRTP